MSDMIEKLVRALWACDPGSVETPFEKLSACALDNLHDTVRAVLEALREPTPEMVAATDHMDDDKYVARGRAIVTWGAMIDSLLTEKRS